MNSSRKNSKVRKQRPTLRGKGDYELSVSEIKKPLDRLEAKIDHLEKRLVHNPMSKATAASTIGRTLGNFVNQGDLGSLAGSTLAKFFGHGDYNIKSNSLIKGPHSAMSGAKFSTEKRGTRITEREFLGEVKAGSLSGSSTVFTLNEHNINPTDPITFPWLSNIAYLFDQWEPHGIVFEFVSTSSEYNGSSQALGTVIAATDYDPYDPPYPDKQAMENADYSCSTKPAHGMLHGIECDPRERPTPILYTSTSNGAPLTSTTLGTFGLATQGCSVANVTLGELWISYDITFYKKQLEPITVPYCQITTAVCALNTGLLSGGGVDSKIITISQPTTGTSSIHLNNLKINTNYIIDYNLNAMVAGDVLSDWTIVNGTMRKVSKAGSSSQLGIAEYLVTTTAPNCVITTVTPKQLVASTYQLMVSEIAKHTWLYAA